MATIKDRETLAKNLQKLREANGLTQQEIASVAGVTRAAVDKWENGDCVPNAIAVSAVASKLGVTVEELVKKGG